MRQTRSPLHSVRRARPCPFRSHTCLSLGPRPPSFPLSLLSLSLSLDSTTPAHHTSQHLFFQAVAEKCRFTIPGHGTPLASEPPASSSLQAVSRERNRATCLLRPPRLSAQHLDCSRLNACPLWVGGGKRGGKEGGGGGGGGGGGDGASRWVGAALFLEPESQGGDTHRDPADWRNQGLLTKAAP